MDEELIKYFNKAWEGFKGVKWQKNIDVALAHG